MLFSRVRCISDDISDDVSADNFVLVVNAREYKTHEKQKNRRREESITVLLPPLQRLSATFHHVLLMLKSSKHSFIALEMVKMEENV